MTALMTAYIAELTARQSTFAREATNYAKRVTAYFRGQLATSITRQQALNFRTWLLSHNLSPSTVNHHLAACSAACNQAGINNPFRQLNLPLNNAVTNYLTPQQEAALLNACAQDKELLAIIVTAIGTGMRRNSILSLTWQQIDFDKRLISFTQKGNRQHHVLMFPGVWDALHNLDRPHPVWVFPNQSTGSHIKDIRKRFKSALAKAGISNFRFHDLRHHAASRLIQAGASLYAVQQVLGHSDPRMTSRYAHLAADYMQSLAAKASVTLPTISPTTNRTRRAASQKAASNQAANQSPRSSGDRATDS